MEKRFQERTLSPDELKLIWQLAVIWYNRQTTDEPFNRVTPRMMLRDAFRHSLREYLEVLHQMESENGFPLLDGRLAGGSLTAYLNKDGDLRVAEKPRVSPDSPSPRQ